MIYEEKFSSLLLKNDKHIEELHSALKRSNIDWLQALKQFFINVSYHILVASLTLMALS